MTNEKRQMKNGKSENTIGKDPAVSFVSVYSMGENVPLNAGRRVPFPASGVFRLKSR
jgi:hypothetical protein